MKVEMIKHPTDEDWMFCKTVALNTVGKKAVNLPNDEWKRKILESEHSPIRTLWFAFKLEIPYWVSVHFVRHKYGVEHFVSTQRDDRTDSRVSRADKPQGEIVTHIIYVNAQEFISMSHRRLCNQASPETRYVMSEMVNKVLETNPEFKSVLVPMCEYRNHKCSEMFPCGRVDNGSK